MLINWWKPIKRHARNLQTTARFCFLESVVFLFVCLVLMVGFISYIASHSPPTPQLSVSSKNKHAAHNITNQDVLWFIHVSDIHMSPQIPYLKEDFELFCNTTIPTINPILVACTGDLADMKEITSWPQPSTLKISEWENYRHILDKTGLNNPSFWLDLRGNHDGYGTEAWDDITNPFMNYSITSMRTDYYPSQKVYSHTLHTPFGNYRFIMMDTTHVPGPNYPMNFFGILDNNMANNVSQELQEANQDPSIRHTFLLGHYPSNMLVSQNGVESMALPPLYNKHPFSAYLCGHLHNSILQSRINHYYGDHGFLELEIGDFKHKRAFRVVSIDNGIVNFNDFRINNWPNIVVTNPKNSRFITELEPWHIMAEMSHVRMLIFSYSSISSIRVSIDDKVLESDFIRLSSKSPLYGVPWDPSLYANGSHHIRVEASDADGNMASVEHDFSLNGQVTGGNLLGYWIQMLDLQTLLVSTFLTFHILYSIVGILIVPRLFLWSKQCFGKQKKFEEDILAIAEQITMQRYYSHLEDRDAFSADDAFDAFDAENWDNLSGDGIQTPPNEENHDDTQVQAVELELIGLEEESSNRNGTYSLSSNRKSQFKFLSNAFQQINNAILLHMWRYGQIPFSLWLFLLIISIYLITGPIIIGPLLNDKIGFAFLWGSYVNGTHLPGMTEITMFVIGPAAVLLIAPLLEYASLPYSPFAIHRQHIRRSHTSSTGGGYQLFNPFARQAGSFRRRTTSFIRMATRMQWVCMVDFGVKGVFCLILMLVSGIGLMVLFGRSAGAMGILVSPEIGWLCLAAVLVVVATQGVHYSRCSEKNDHYQ